MDELAASTGLPRSGLTRTLGALCDGNLIECSPGPPSRWRLSMAADAICLADIIDAVEAEPPSAPCPLRAQSCKHASRCHVCWALIDAELSASETLGRYSLATLSGEASEPVEET